MRNDRVSQIKVKVLNRKTKKNQQMQKQRFKNKKSHRLKMLSWALKTLYLTLIQFQIVLITLLRNTTQISYSIIKVLILHHQSGLNKLYNKTEMMEENRGITFHQADKLENNNPIIGMKLRTIVYLIKWIGSYLHKAITINRNNLVSLDMKTIQNIKQIFNYQCNLIKIKQILIPEFINLLWLILRFKGTIDIRGTLTMEDLIKNSLFSKII